MKYSGLAHDDELALWCSKRQRGGSLVRTAVPGTVVTIVALVGGLWWQQIEKRRVLLVQIQLERAAEAKRVEQAAQEAKRRQDMLVAEAEARRVEEQARLRFAQEPRAAALKTEQYVAGKTFVTTLRLRQKFGNNGSNGISKVSGVWPAKLRWVCAVWR